MRIGSFNVENLFDRAVALKSDDWAKGREALDAYSQINTILNKTVYSDEDKAEIVKLLRALGLGGSDDGKRYARLRQNRGRLLKRSGNKIEITAKGRADWIGWVELKMEPVNQMATQHTAMVMRDVDADVLAVIEADNRVALLKFGAIVFKKIKATPYNHVMLIDGNDDRGIDVGLLTKQYYEIVRIRSHVDDRDADGLIFSRDCPEYTIRAPSGERLVLLVNHFKSKGHGKQADSNAKRERQAARVAQIYNELVADGEEHIAIAGDFNDFPESPPLAPLLAQTDLKDTSRHNNFDPGSRPGTFGNCTAKQKIDYILLSPALYARITGGGIFRMGAWGGKNGDLWPHYPSLTSQVQAASDHCAIYTDLNL